MGREHERGASRERNEKRRGFFARKRRQATDRVQARAGEKVDDLRELAGEMKEKASDATREKRQHAKAQAKRKGKLLAHDTMQALGALLIGLLAVVFGLLALLTAIAFLVSALAEPLPTWAAGFIGAAILAGIGLVLGRIAKRRIDRMIAVDNEGDDEPQVDEPHEPQEGWRREEHPYGRRFVPDERH